ncbi:MAG TPA: VOC family protein [Actinomycetota bacterium]|nr:VOC family protein [Actinomycetota bacterium]
MTRDEGLSGSGEKTAATDFARFGAVELDVVDLDRSLPFWETAVGLEVFDRTAGVATLGAGGNTLLRLYEGAERPALRGHSGLYHLAIHVPDQEEFSTVLARLIAHRLPIAPTDHVMSKAIYLDDPDGIGLEITLETPERMRSMSLSNGQPVVIDAEGRVRSGRDPLNIRAELDASASDIHRSLSPGTVIGHVHLHVADVDRALAFYSRLGFQMGTHSKEFGFADMHGGGVFRHRMAVNTWQGKGATPRPAGVAGLRRFEIRYANPEQRESVIAELAGELRAGDEGDVRDPDSHRIALL